MRSERLHLMPQIDRLHRKLLALMRQNDLAGALSLMERRKEMKMNHAAPRISVIIPVYNSGKYLARCLDGMEAQTFSEFEVLVVDDKSTDDSREIVKSYQARDPRINLIALDVNVGSGIARNAGIDRARGEYLSFIDCDDTVSPNFLEELYKSAKKSEADIAKCTCMDIKNGICSLASRPSAVKARLDSGKDILHSLYISEHWSMIYKRSFLEEHHIRYGEARVSHDSVFLFKVRYFAKSFEPAENAVYYYHQNEGSAVHTFTEKRFFNSLQSVSEMVDFINEVDPFSEPLLKSLSGYLSRQIPVYSYMCVQDGLREHAAAFAQRVCAILSKLKNIDALIELDYSVRVLMQSRAAEVFSPGGRVVGVDNNLPWRLEAFRRLAEHLDSDRAQKEAGISFLISSLKTVSDALETYEELDDPEADKRRFYGELRSILLNLNCRPLFLEKGGIAARALLEYGANLFLKLNRKDDVQYLCHTHELLKRTLDIIEAHPQASPEYRKYARKLADSLLSQVTEAREQLPELAADITFRLFDQLKRLNALR